MYLAIQPEELHTIPDISESFEISRNHLMKVVNNLVNHGYVKSVRGRNGGLMLANPAQTIRVGAVVKDMEVSMQLADCETCPLVGCCNLRHALADASRAFIQTLNEFTLEDICSNEKQLLKFVR